jgi:hypothetical protein
MAGRVVIKDGRLVFKRPGDPDPQPLVIVPESTSDECTEAICEDCCDGCPDAPVPQDEFQSGDDLVWQRTHVFPLRQNPDGSFSLIASITASTYAESDFTFSGGSYTNSSTIDVTASIDINFADNFQVRCREIIAAKGFNPPSEESTVTGTVSISIDGSFSDSDGFSGSRTATMDLNDLEGYLGQHFYSDRPTSRISLTFFKASGLSGSFDVDEFKLNIELFEDEDGNVCAYFGVAYRINLSTTDGSDTLSRSLEETTLRGVLGDSESDTFTSTTVPDSWEFTASRTTTQSGPPFDVDRSLDISASYSQDTSVLKCVWGTDAPTAGLADECENAACVDENGNVIDSRCCTGELDPDDPLCGVTEPSGCCPTVGEWFFGEEANTSFTALWNVGRYNTNGLLLRQWEGSVPSILRPTPPTQNDCEQLRTGLTSIQTAGVEGVYAVARNFSSSPSTLSNTAWAFTVADMGYDSALPGVARFNFECYKPSSSSILFSVANTFNGPTCSFVFSSTDTSGVNTSHFTQTVCDRIIPTPTTSENFYVGGTSTYTANDVDNRTLGVITVGVSATNYALCDMMGGMGAASWRGCGCVEKDQISSDFEGNLP